MTVMNITPRKRNKVVTLYLYTSMTHQIESDKFAEFEQNSKNS